MNTLWKRLLAGFLMLSLSCNLVPLLAQTAKKSTTEKKAPVEKSEPAAKEKKERPLPYRGKLSAVDNAGKTFTVGQRVFQVNAETKFYKGEKTPATMSEGVVGEPIRLSYIKTADGKFLAHNVYFGAKPENAGEEKKADAAAKGQGKKKNEN